MTSFKEGELRFSFGDEWHAEHFDRPGAAFPKGVSPVDFMAERAHELVLVEVKDPSAARARVANRQADTPWKRTYVSDCIVVPVEDVGKALPGCSASRVAP